MASAQQSALDFIKKGRDLLEKRLQNLSVVLSKLLDHKVLDEDQVTNVKSISETSEGSKRMIDLVICKGEAACYEFLKILDSTRSATFPKPGIHNPDLHHWISCFSFVDDLQTQSETGNGVGPCSKYQQDLKRKAKEILKEKWRHNVDFLNNEAREKTFKYIPLVLDTDAREVFKIKSKAYKKLRSKKLKTYIPTDRKNLSPEYLLTNNEKKILLIGKPGIGKTTVAQQVLRLWTEQNDSQGSYMFYFDEPLMRIMSHTLAPSTLKSFLFDMYLKPKEGIDEILKDMEENSENVTIILDGIMDVIDNPVLRKILEKEVLCDAKILTTCRPEAEDFSILADWPSYRVEVHGFDANSIHAYFEWMLGTENYAKCHALNNLELFSLCHVPMYAFIVTACMPLSLLDACRHPNTITEMYVQIFHYCLRKNSKQNAQNLNKYIQENKEEITFLAKYSYEAMQAKTVCIENVQNWKDEGMQYVFLTSLSSKVSSASYTHFSVFLHNTMQEFWAALFLLIEPDNISDALSRCRNEDGKYLKYIFPFLCGLLSKTEFESVSCLVSEEHIQHITSTYFKNIFDTFLYSVDPEEAEADNMLFICQCLYEYQSPEACLDFLNRVNNELDLSDEILDPHHCCVLSYVISQSPKQNVELNLENCSLSEPGVKMILGCLKNLQRLSISSKMQRRIWNVALHAERETDFDNLLRLLGFHMYLAVQDQMDQKVLINARTVLAHARLANLQIALDLDVRYALHDTLLDLIMENLTEISDISFSFPEDQAVTAESWNKSVSMAQITLYLKGAQLEAEKSHTYVEHLLLVLRNTHSVSSVEQSEFTLMLYSRTKELKVPILKALQPVFQTLLTSWVIDLSGGKTALVLEIMRLQTDKKPVELRGQTDEDNELTNVLQCLPFISQLRFSNCMAVQDNGDTKIRNLVKLFTQALSMGNDTVGALLAACSYTNFPFAEENKDSQTEFLLNLFSYLVNERQTEEGLLKAILPLYQSVSVWVVDLSNGKISVLLLQILKRCQGKTRVELKDKKGSEEGYRSFLQCLPYVSQLSFSDGLCHYTSALVRVVELITCASSVGDESLKSLSSVCSYSTFPFAKESEDMQRTFLLDLYNYAVSAEGSVLPFLKTVYESVPTVWTVDLCDEKIVLLLRILKLQTVKKPVELSGWSGKREELTCLLECVPYVSKLRVSATFFDNSPKTTTKVFVDLFTLASSRERELHRRLLSVCSYSTFPFAEDDGYRQTSFLLGLYSHILSQQTQVDSNIFSFIEKILHKTPEVWKVDFSEGNTSALHQVLELQTVKRPVEVRGWPKEESILRDFLLCLPHVPKLSCVNGLLQSLCEVLSMDSQWNPKLISLLLRPMGYAFTLARVLHSRICRAVGEVLTHQDPQENLSLTLIPEAVSWKGAELLLSDVTHLQTLRMNEVMILKMAKMVKRCGKSIIIEELQVTVGNPGQASTSRLLSGLALLLRVWTVKILNVIKLPADALSLICLLCLNTSFFVRMSQEALTQVVEVVYSVQDASLTQLFIEKIDGDLSQCIQSWSVLQYFIQHSNTPIAINPQRIQCDVHKIMELLQIPKVICFKGIKSKFVKDSLREIYRQRAGHLVSKLTQSCDNEISLKEEQLDPSDFDALRFALHYSDGIRLDLTDAIIPLEDLGNILTLLHRVSQLRVDQKLLINLIHASVEQKTKEQINVTVSLFRALQYKLDFSSHDEMYFNAADCRAISTAIVCASNADLKTHLTIRDCQVEESGIEELFPILNKAIFSFDKTLLKQFVSAKLRCSEMELKKSSSDILKVVGKELDLSHVQLDSLLCKALGLILEQCDGLSKMDFSHCQLTDESLDPLLPHLHKAQVVNLDNNDITDQGAQRIHSFLANSHCTKTVCLFNNSLLDVEAFVVDSRFEILPSLDENKGTIQEQKQKIQTDLSQEVQSCEAALKKCGLMENIDPEIVISNGKMSYRFQASTGGTFNCKKTGLIFELRRRARIKYCVVPYNTTMYSASEFEPAGPLFDIICSKTDLCQLHLPHCETEVDAIGDLVVMHISSRETKMLTPVMLTQTHVAVRIHGLCKFGILRRKQKKLSYRPTGRVLGQVLLFLEPHVKATEHRLWVFLLSRNVPPSEILEQQKEYRFVKTSSNCILRRNGRYKLISDLATHTQPKMCVFKCLYKGYHHPAFEVFFDCSVTEMHVKIQDRQRPKQPWDRRVIFKASCDHVKTEVQPEKQGGTSLTEGDWLAALFDILDELDEEQLKRLKSIAKALEGLPQIPKGKLEKAKGSELAVLLIESWGFEASVKATQALMKKLPRNDFAVTSKLIPFLKHFGFIDKLQSSR